MCESQSGYVFAAGFLQSQNRFVHRASGCEHVVEDNDAARREILNFFNGRDVRIKNAFHSGVTLGPIFKSLFFGVFFSIFSEQNIGSDFDVEIFYFPR